MRNGGNAKWKMVRKLVLRGLAVLAVLLLCGAVYEWFSARHDAKSYTAPGLKYEVNGKKMHLYVEGEGEVTAVFAAGWGTTNPYVDFYPLYEGLRPHVRIAVYDRPGYGYSDGTGEKRDIDTIVGETHDLLKAADVKPPYVLAGHSLGALETIRFAQKYPDEVKGIVFIDGGSPEYYAASQPLGNVIPYVQGALVKTGVARLLFHSPAYVRSLNSERNGLAFVPERLQQVDRKSALLEGRPSIRQSVINSLLADTQPIAIGPSAPACVSRRACLPCAVFSRFSVASRIVSTLA